jgi:hypothetical protein
LKKKTASNEVLFATDGLNSHERLVSSRHGVLCALALAVCVLMTYPNANMPMGDDFSYTKTALDFAYTGHFVFNGWATAMLGWMVPWGALFVRLFGFSFNAVRLSILPIAMACIFLFHQILRRFEVNPENAVLGTLTLALSPLFLPMAATYMTDVPGLFVILLCIYMCQAALSATSDRIALFWLCAAALLNVAGGTVRQIAWLGALVMVPSTAWLLRKRNGMKIAGAVVWLLSLAGVFACLHWWNVQPYSVPEHVLVGPIQIWKLRNLADQLVRASLCLLLVLFPVLSAWLPTAFRLGNWAQVRIAVAIAGLIVLAIALYKHAALDRWVMPWLVPVLGIQGMGESDMFGVTPVTLTLPAKLGISLLIIATAAIFVEQISFRNLNEMDNSGYQTRSWKNLAWILGPFSISYILLLAPRGVADVIQDRYLLGLMPCAIVVLLRLYQEQVATRLPAVSFAVLSVFAIYAIGGTHDLFAVQRALVRTLQMVEGSGIPRRSIQATNLAVDGWAQLEEAGHINSPLILVPRGAYTARIPDLSLPKECTYWFAKLASAIVPKYFVVLSPVRCFGQTEYPPVDYRTWLPPFHRRFYVQQLVAKSK